MGLHFWQLRVLQVMPKPDLLVPSSPTHSIKSLTAFSHTQLCGHVS